METYDFFRRSICGYAAMPDEPVRQLYALCSRHTIRKGEYFIRAGDPSAYMGLNLDGLFRFYYTDAEGNEFTKGFNDAGKFLISYSAIVQKRPSFFSIEALQDSRILKFEFAALERMAQQDSRWYLFFFKLLESIYIMKELREKSFLLDDAMTRYREFQTQYAHVEDKIKLYHVASFLGITPEALSRIRNRKN